MTDFKLSLPTEILPTLRLVVLRLDTLEHRFEYLDHDVLKAIGSASNRVTLEEDERGDEGDDNAPDTDEEPRPAGIAFLSDGRTALHVSHLGGAELHDHETWTGVVLHVAEACDVLTRINDAADETAGHVVGGMLFGYVRRDEGGDDEGGSGASDA